MPEQVKDPATNPDSGSAAIKAPELPKEKFFDERTMMDWAEKAEVFEKTPPSGPTPGAPKTPESKDTKTPLAVLKVNGKDIPVYTQEDLVKYAQMGYDYTQKRQRDSTWEKDLEQRESKLEKLADPLNALAEAVRTGKITVGSTTPQKKTVDESPFGPDEETEEVEDPVAKAKLDANEKRLKDLEEKMQPQIRERNARIMQETAQAIETEVQRFRTETPFDDIVDPESQDNLTNEMYAGFVSVQQKKDDMRAKLDKSFEPRPMPEILKAAAVAMNRYQTALKGGTPPTALTVESLTKSNPDLVQSIAQAAIDQFVKENGGRAPILRPSGSGARTSASGESKKITSIDEGLRQAMQDSEVMESLDEMGQMERKVRHYGLK